MAIANFRFHFLIVLALLLSACKNVTVSNPTAESVHTAAPDVALAFPKGKPDTLVVLLNKKDITSMLTISDTGATVSGSAVNALLVDGYNYLEVTKPATPSVRFTVDKSGPTVHVTAVEEGSQLTIRGYVEDPSGIKSVTVNGAALTLGTGNTFTASVANSASYVTFVGTDNLNQVRTQKFARPSVSVTNSMSLRINRRGLDFLTDEVEALLASSALSTLLAGANPLHKESILGNYFEINVTDAKIGSADLSLGIATSGDGTLNVSGTIINFWGTGNLFIDPLIGWDSRTNGTVAADRVTFSSTAKVTIVNSKPTVSLSTLNLGLGNLNVSFGILPSWLLSPIANVFKGIIEWILEGQIKSILPKKMNELLDTFPDSLVLDVNGNKIKPSVLMSTFTSPSNGLNMSMGARLAAQTTNGPKIVGSQWKDMGPVPAATNTSPSGVVRDIGLVISSNVINQALAAATASGMLNVTVSNTDIPGLSNTSGITAGESVRARLRPASAPTIELVKRTDGLGTLRMHDLYFAIDTTSGANNAFQLLMGATIDLEVTADLGITDKNAIALEIVGVPTVRVRSIDPTSAFALSERLAQKFLDEVTLKVLPVVMSAIGAVPLPSFEGYGLSVGELWVTDTNANYAALVASLVKTTTTAKSPAPMTYARVKNATLSSKSGLSSAAASTAVAVKGNTAVIALDGYNPSEGSLQYRFSLNGAPMSLWKERTSLRFAGLEPGLHTVKVCARTALLVEDPECTSVSFAVGAR
jgi:hypothetical protein